MKILRSWPTPHTIEEFDRLQLRAHVVDQLERLCIENYDYTPLGDIHENVLLLEWDIAASREQMHQMINLAEADPDRIRVAPYLLYEARPVPVWAHRRVTPDGAERWIENYELEAEYFSFGMIYLPHKLVRHFLEADPKSRGLPIGVEPHRYEDYRFTDQTFSVWHYRTFQTSVDVLWGVRPVHLNY